MTTQNAHTRNKGRAQRGASMPLALLLFLICTVLASIVIAAATATAGQATTLKESEQSYYAVTSAAKLFQNQLDGGTVHIEQGATRTDTVTTTYTNPSGGTGGGSTTTRVKGEPTGYTLKINDSELLPKAGNTPTFFELVVLKQLGIDAEPSAGGSISLSSVAQTAWNASLQYGGASSPTYFTVDSDVADQAVAVTVKREVKPDSTIELTFKKKQNDSGGGSGGSNDGTGYSLKMTLTADVNTNESSREEMTSSTVTPSASGYKREDKVEVTEVRDITVTWWASELSSTN